MKKVLVIGAARSGSAVCKLLVKHGYEVHITDMNAITNKDELSGLGIHIYEGGHPDILKEIDYAFVVKNPGIPYHVPFIQYFVEKQTPIYTEIEIAYWFSSQFEYGAISGTNGKTTITTMLYELLQYNEKALVAGNIGIPLSECVLTHENEVKQVALELSNFQLLGTQKFAPKVSCICNLSPDHLDYMKSEEAYYTSKMRIYENQSSDSYFLRNVDDALVMKYATNIPCKVLDFSLVNTNVDIYMKEGSVYYHNLCLFHISDLQVVGEHNISNAMIAATMAYLMDVSVEDIQLGLSKFKSVEHRLEFVANESGMRFYNDSKATNPEAVVPALKAFDKNIILLAGGYDKQLDVSILSEYDARVKHCFSFGQTKHDFTNVFTHVTSVETMKDAFTQALQIANKEDVILLSPACASYDQFTSYEQRGSIFKQYVQEYIEKKRGNV